MKGLKKGLAMLLVLVACLALTTMAFAAEYTVRPGSSIRVSLTQSGNGGIDYASAEAWKQLIRETGVSYFAWSLSNKAETSALISSSCSRTSGWSDAELSETGRWLKTMLATTNKS